MSDLEKFIMENRNELDNDQPDKGHVERFRKKLSGQNRHVRRMNTRYFLQIAASVAIILASGVVIIKSSKGSNKMAMSPEIQEFTRAKEFYVSQVNEKYDEIAGFQFSSEEEKTILLEELNTMDQYYQQLLNDFQTNPGDERVVSALIQHYQMKLDVMDQILEQLISLKEIDRKDENENTNI